MADYNFIAMYNALPTIYGNDKCLRDPLRVVDHVPINLSLANSHSRKAYKFDFYISKLMNAILIIIFFIF